jgi:internalin A
MRLPRVQFTVRRMIALISIIGCGLGWVVHRAHVQRDAVAAIRRAGGYVRYDWMFPGDRYNPNATVPAPKWLVDLIGIDYFGNVVWVIFRIGKGGSDAELAQAATFDRLGVLVVHSSRITDAGLEHLRSLTGLGDLCLRNSKISDNGLVNLEGMLKLEGLDLNNTNISDDGLVHIKKLKAILTLDLGNTAVSDIGIEHLKQLTKLQDISLRGTKVTDAGVAALRQAIPGVCVTR